MINKEELFPRFKDKLEKEVSCIHGVVSGAPGYYGFLDCELNNEVRYWGKQCPQDCPNYSSKNDKQLMSIFEHYNSFYGDGFMERYCRDGN